MKKTYCTPYCERIYFVEDVICLSQDVSEDPFKEDLYD